MENKDAAALLGGYWHEYFADVFHPVYGKEGIEFAKERLLKAVEVTNDPATENKQHAHAQVEAHRIILTLVLQANIDATSRTSTIVDAKRKTDKKIENILQALVKLESKKDVTQDDWQTFRNDLEAEVIS